MNQELGLQAAPGQVTHRSLNGYTVLEKLGRGSTFIAHRAQKGGKDFCLRELRFGKRTDDCDEHKLLELFQREAAVLAKLDHPRVPRMHEVFESENGPQLDFYVVQDFIPGETLKTLVERERALTEDRILDIALQATDILTYLHQQEPPVVHRDIKPSNMMMDADGKVHLIDFGAVQQRLIETIGGSTMFGTLGYAPLEVIAGQAVPQSDLYSLGATLLALKSGKDASNFLDGMQLKYKEKVHFDNPSLEYLVDCLTEPRVEDRPKTAEEVTELLQRIKDGYTLVKPEDGKPGLWTRLISSLVNGKVLSYLLRHRRDDVEKVQRKIGNGKVIFTGKKHLSDSSFSIEELPDRYRLHGIPYAGASSTIDWSKELLDEGSRHTQDEWVQLLQHQEFQLPSTQLCYATCRALYQQREGDHAELVEKVHALLKKDFTNYWMMTSTRIQYNPAAPDTVIQDYGTPRETPAAVDFIGPNGYLFENSLVDESEALFGTRDKKEVDAVWRSINGKKPYLWRLNSRPNQREERCVVLGVDVNGVFYIGADVIISLQRPARGVVVVPSS